MLRLRTSDDAPRAGVLIVLVGAVLVCWMLLMPPGSQPDEPGHIVRAAAVVRADGADGVHVLPDRYEVAEPACYAFDPTRPASCAEVPQHRGVEVELTTRAGDYPPGAHALFGAAGLLPGLDPIWWGRLAAVAVAAVLVGASLAAALDRSRLTAAALLLGLTPMAWSIMTAVNPSAVAVAGAVALWLGVLRSAERGDDRFGWLLVAGWAALAVSRRDGLVWAVVIVSVAALATGVTPSRLGGLLGRWRLAVVGVSTLVTVVWGLGSSSSTSRLIVVAPLVLVAVDGAQRWWRRAGAGWWSARTRAAQVAVATGCAFAAGVAWLLVLATRPGGWDTDLALAVVEQTDENVIEAFGVLGWLDTQVPQLTLFTWLLAIGALVGTAVATRSWRPAAALALLAAATSWTFELLQGNDSGTYWQGRYSLPLLVGLPLLLVLRAGRTDDDPAARRLVAPVTVTSLLVVDVAAWAAARRFGVGATGSRFPWRWDTPVQPVAPIVLLVTLAVASIALALTVVGPRAARR